MIKGEIQNELFYFLGVAIIFIISIAIIFRIFSKKFKFNSKNIELYGLLLNLNNSSLISISAMTIYYLFVVFCTISFHGMNIIYLSGITTDKWFAVFPIIFNFGYVTNILYNIRTMIYLMTLDKTKDESINYDTKNDNDIVIEKDFYLYQTCVSQTI